MEEKDKIPEKKEEENIEKKHEISIRSDLKI